MDTRKVAVDLRGGAIVKNASPFHSGELAVQRLTGEVENAAINAGGFMDAIPPGGVAFVERQRTVAVSGIGSDAGMWVTLISGDPGFAQVVSEDRRQLRLLLADPAMRSYDPVFASLSPGAAVGSLLIDLSTRRRLRANGNVLEVTDASLTYELHEVFGNCPKYIQKRAPTEYGAASTNLGEIGGEQIGPEAMALIARCDTAFVGSSDGAGHADASHRGGPPGFIRVDAGQNQLKIPDYPGNGMFNTLGNLTVDPRIGLCLVDFAQRMQLQISGVASFDFSQRDGELEPTGGTGRWWSVKIGRWRLSGLPSPAGWNAPEPSPYNPPG